MTAAAVICAMKIAIVGYIDSYSGLMKKTQSFLIFGKLWLSSWTKLPSRHCHKSSGEMMWAINSRELQWCLKANFFFQIQNGIDVFAIFCGVYVIILTDLNSLISKSIKGLFFVNKRSKNLFDHDTNS